MTEFELSNGQTVELTKDGVLIKGNDIKIEGMISIRKDDKYISVVEQDGNKIKQFSVNIDDEPIKTTVNLDTEAIQKLIKKAIQNAQHMKDVLENVSKQPHVRIEFDDIRDVPKVWVDGELIGRVEDDKPLVSLKVDWNTDTATENHKGFDVNYFDMTDGRGKSTGFHEGSVM